METKECIFCKRILIDEKVPICHHCRGKIKDGTLAVGAICLGAVKLLPKGIKKAKDIL